MKFGICTISLFVAICLHGQIPMKPHTVDLPQEVIDGYFKTDVGREARKKNKFMVKYDPQRKAVNYSWVSEGKRNWASVEFSNQVNCTLQCTISTSGWPLAFNYRVIVPPESHQSLYELYLSSFTQEETRFFPKQTSLERQKISYRLEVNSYGVYPDSSGVDSMGYPAYFDITYNPYAQQDAKKEQKDYISDMQYVSWCLPAIVPCHGRGNAKVASKGDDSTFLDDWDAYEKRLKLNYMWVFGMTLGPGLDTAKATPLEVMTQLLKDVETARREHWFSQDEDAKTVLAGLHGIQDSLKSGNRAEAKRRIEKSLNQLEALKGRAKTEVFSLVEVNLRFVASKI